MERAVTIFQQGAAGRPETPAFVRKEHAGGSIGGEDVSINMPGDAPAGFPNNGQSCSMVSCKLQFDRVAVEHLPFEHDGKAAAHIYEIVLHHEMQIGKLGLYFGFLFSYSAGSLSCHVMLPEAMAATA